MSIYVLQREIFSPKHWGDPEDYLAPIATVTGNLDSMPMCMLPPPAAGW